MVYELPYLRLTISRDSSRRMKRDEKINTDTRGEQEESLEEGVGGKVSLTRRLAGRKVLEERCEEGETLGNRRKPCSASRG